MYRRHSGVYHFGGEIVTILIIIIIIIIAAETIICASFSYDIIVQDGRREREKKIKS